MKYQETDLQKEKHENSSGSTRRKLTKEELTALCRRVEKHTQKFGEYMRMVEETRKKEGTRGKFSLKSLNSSNLDTVENNTDNVQIKSDNFKNWFGDWENNPSKASKVVMRTAPLKWCIMERIRGAFMCLTLKCLTIKFRFFFSDSKVTSITFYHFLSR